MFERFTERARQVVVLAPEEAKTMHHAFIGAEHILLGLVREEEGLASRVLAGFDVTADLARALIVEATGEGDKDAPLQQQVPFTPRGKKVLEGALREALSLGHNYIGTEHILLALVREDSGLASQVLDKLGVDTDQIRTEVVRNLSGPRAKARSTIASTATDVFQLLTPPVTPGMGSATFTVEEQVAEEVFCELRDGEAWFVFRQPGVARRSAVPADAYLARQYQARDNANRPDRPRTGTCENCGGPRRGDTVSRHGDRLCATCRKAAR